MHNPGGPGNPCISLGSGNFVNWEPGSLSLNAKEKIHLFKKCPEAREAAGDKARAGFYPGCPQSYPQVLWKVAGDRRRPGVRG